MKRLLFVLLLAGCSKPKADAAPPVVIDAAPPPPAPLLDAGAKAPTSAERAAAVRDLNAGRALARQQSWKGALAAFDRALAVAPDDARVLSEVGWAAFQANDLARAETANAHALANTSAPLVRAPILYNVGRVAEERGNKLAARKAYAESLGLRENAEVRRRLQSLGVDGGADEDVDRPGVPAGCTGEFDDAHAFCKCLLAQKEDGLFPVDEKRTCTKEIMAGSLDDPRLDAVVWGPEVLGERLHLLLAREGTRSRVVAELGRDYEPGAFGVHNEASVKKGAKRSVGGHTVVVVTSLQNDNDANMAGLELCIHHAKLETVCALGDTPGATRCTPAIPVAIESGCGPGAEIDDKDLDAETRQLLAEMKKNAKKTHADATWKLEETGTLTVTIGAGSRDSFGANVLRPHVLWR